jgi:hypothetical protein
MKLKHLFLFLLFVMPTAFAQPEPRSPWLPDTVVVHVTSRHSVPGFNENNPGLGLGWQAGWQLGFFENSQSRGRNAARDARRYTTYVGYRLSTEQHRLSGPVSVSAALDGGVHYGYRNCTNPGAPGTCRTIAGGYLLPSAALHVGAVAVRIGLVLNQRASNACTSPQPAAPAANTARWCAVTLSLEYSF